MMKVPRKHITQGAHVFLLRIEKPRNRVVGELRTGDVESELLPLLEPFAIGGLRSSLDEVLVREVVL